MLSDPATQDERYPFPVHYGRLLAVDGFLKDYQSAAEAEARRILDATEPNGASCMVSGEQLDALADALASAVADGGLLDRLAGGAR